MNKEQLRQIIVPSWGQVVICIGIAAAILAVAFGSLPYQFLLHITHIHNSQAATVYQGYLNYLDGLTVVRLAGIGLFWLAAALVAYVSGLALMKAMVTTRNELITQTEFVGHPSWSWRARFLVVQLAVAIGFLVVLGISGTLLLSLWLSLFQKFVTDLGTRMAIAELVGSVGGLTFNIYLIWTLGQIVFLID
jgi:hypothetical protein